jgi:hypothetical protein
VSDRLIQLYKQNKKEVINALLGAILPKGDTNSYRNNLYIVFTLGRITDGWEGSDDQLRTIAQLKETSSYQDPTFKSDVTRFCQNAQVLGGIAGYRA